ncbi:MAG TPA: hypothetical protein VGO27_22850 [Candidatus Acidoferrum sp.]|nr:hypothetical protein [Candidatus Acidoferrum sp.]
MNFLQELRKVGRLGTGRRRFGCGRATGGYFNVTKLVGALRPDFELRDYPDFEADWKGIDAITAENMRGIHIVLAART